MCKTDNWQEAVQHREPSLVLSDNPEQWDVGRGLKRDGMHVYIYTNIYTYIYTHIYIYMYIPIKLCQIIYTHVKLYILYKIIHVRNYKIMTDLYCFMGETIQFLIY